MSYISIQHKPRCCIGMDFLEVFLAICRCTFQHHADQRTSEETGQLIDKILKLVT